MFFQIVGGDVDVEWFWGAKDSNNVDGYSFACE